MSDIDLKEIHQDLLTQVLSICKKKNIILKDSEVGYSLVLDNPDAENTTVKVKKGNDKYFKMMVDLDGNEKSKDLKELAELFVDCLEKNIQHDMYEDYKRMMLEVLFNNG